MGTDCCCERQPSKVVRDAAKLVNKGPVEEAALTCDLYDTFIFDVDGTLYHNGKPIPGVVESIHKLIVRHNKKILFYTNGGHVTRQSHWEKIYKLFRQVLDEESFGEIASTITKDCIYNTAHLTAKYLAEEL